MAGVPCNKVSEPPSGRRQQISPRRRDQSLQFCQSYEFCELVGEGLKHDDGLRTGIFDPTLKFVRRVERIDVHYGGAGAQGTGKNDGKVQHVRKHDRHALACHHALRLQPGGDRGAASIEFGIVQVGAHAGVGDPGAVACE